MNVVLTGKNYYITLQKVIKHEIKNNYNIKCIKFLDKDILIELLDDNVSISMRHINKEFYDDKELIKKIAKFDSECLKFIDNSLSKDKRFILDILHINKWCSHHINPILANNYEIASIIVVSNASHLLSNSKFRNNKKLARQSIMSYPSTFKYFGDKIKNNKSIVEMAINKNFYNYVYISERLKKDVNIAIDVVLRNRSSYNDLLNFELKINEKVFTNYINKWDCKYNIYIYDIIKCHKNLALLFIEKFGVGFSKLSEELRDDIDIFNIAIEKNPSIFEFASERIKNIEWLVKPIVYNNPYIYKDCPDIIKNNKEIIFHVAKNYPESWKHLPDDYKNNREIIKLCLNKCNNMPIMFDWCKDDEELVNIALKSYESAYNIGRYISNRLRDKKYIAVKLAIYDIDAIYAINNELLADYDVALRLVISRPSNLRNNIIMRYKDNYEFVKKAMIRGKNFDVLLYASYRIINIKELILMAMELNPDNFYYAGRNLKNDYDMVMYAVKIDGTLLRHASKRLRNNIEIVTQAYISSPYESIKYAGITLKNNKVFI